MKAERDCGQGQRRSLIRIREGCHQRLEAVACVCLLVGCEGLFLNGAEYSHD